MKDSDTCLASCTTWHVRLLGRWNFIAICKEGLNISREGKKSDTEKISHWEKDIVRYSSLSKHSAFYVTNYSSSDHTLQMFCFWQHMPCSAWSRLSCTHYPLQHEEDSSVTVYMKTHSFSFCSYPVKQMSMGTFTSHTDWHQTRSWHPVSTGNWWAKCKLTRSQHGSAWLSAPSNQG